MPFITTLDLPTGLLLAGARSFLIAPESCVSLLDASFPIIPVFALPILEYTNLSLIGNSPEIPLVDFKKLFLIVFATVCASVGAIPSAINLEVIVLNASGCIISFLYCPSGTLPLLSWLFISFGISKPIAV